MGVVRGSRIRRGATTFGLLLAGLLAVASPVRATDIHVDCSSATSGDGSLDQPFNALGPGFDLGPGDRLLLRRDTSCPGILKITGDGSPASRAEVGAYGAGSAPRVIGTGQEAVLVEDVSYLTLRDLDVSNPGANGPLGEGDMIRNGVRVTAGTETVRGLTLSGLKVHDVDGDLTKGWQGSAAIQVTAEGAPPVRFDGLTISDNEIRSVSRSAISIMGSGSTDRPSADVPWAEASTGVSVTDNVIDLIAGDGIVTRGTDGALIQGNRVSRGNLAGRPLLHPDGPICNAGIWAFRANNTLIRGNEVSDMEHNGCDGTGFDIDYRQDGTVVEANYSHGNEGGFILLCTDSELHRADVRFNLSEDDGTMINHGPCGIAEGILGDLSGVRMFNNTVVGESPTVSVQLGVSGEMYQPGSFMFRNNLVYARKSMAAIPCGANCSHNAFFGLPPSGSKPVTADPLLTDGFRLGQQSPLRGAGTPIQNGGFTDFFGNPVPAVPSIGFDQSPRRPNPGPSIACLRARSELGKARQKVKKLIRKLRALRQKNASRARIRMVRQRLRKASAARKTREKQVSRLC